MGTVPRSARTRGTVPISAEALALGAGRPVVVVSKCLGFEHCRYNGEIVDDPFVRRLREFVEFRPVCPEMEIGLGVPRDPIRVVRVEHRMRLVQPSTGKDFSESMEAFCSQFISGVVGVDGFLLKARSPSCGTRDVKIYNETGNLLSAAQRQGFFGRAAMRRFGDAAVEDEGRLRNFLVRERFLTMLYTLARFRELATEPTMARLTDFHARHKLLLMTYSEVVMRQLGKLGANEERRSVADVFKDYGALLPRAFAGPPKYTAAINVLMHALGYFRGGLTADEKAFFLDSLERYRAGKVPLSVPVGILGSWVVRFNQPYLAQQLLFQPYPEALLDIADSGKGR
ncbi:MAG TPA: DUF523 and DUF1722 domain-containing protein [bacterium]|nr:DUF523 and DUF1722 domain-containing protein [bacterium]